MNEKANSLLRLCRPLVPQSGTVSLKLDGQDIGKLQFKGPNVTFLVNERIPAGKLFHIIPRRLHKLSTLSFVSGFLEQLGLSMVLRNNSGELVELGKGAHSILGKEKIKILRVIRYLR